MTTLAETLQHPPEHLAEFLLGSLEALQSLQSEASIHTNVQGYSILKANNVLLRPLRTELYIADSAEYSELSTELTDSMANGTLRARDGRTLDRVLYTAMMARACLFDAHLSRAAARKSIGTVFSSMLRNVFRAIGHDVLTLKLRLETEVGSYRYPISLVANSNKVRSTAKKLSSADLLITPMITTKDRLAGTFTDKLLLEKYFSTSLRFSVVALHDVQRSSNNIQSTFPQGALLLNSKFVTRLGGLYYFDVPQMALTPPFKGLVRPFHELVS